MTSEVGLQKARSVQLMTFALTTSRRERVDVVRA